MAYYISNIQPPERVLAVERQIDVRTIGVEALALTMSTSGFGSAMPDRTWSALSNVKGHVIFRHSDLESGAVLPEGTLVLEVDPALYTLALTEANAEIASIDAEITQLSQEVENAAALLDLEQQRLELAEQELERTTSLAESGAVPRASLDAQLKATLQQRQAVQALVNQQNIFPIQLSRLQAQRDRALTKRAQVQNDLEDTRFHAPFDMRVSEVNVEMHQLINPGQVLFSGDGISASEVVLQVPMQSLRRVMAELPDSDESLNIAALSAYVQLVGDDQRWDAKVIRIANGIDPATRTVRVVLRIEQPESMADAFDHPPLPKGMYVEGVLEVASLEPHLIIPQSALHEGWVYLVDADNRLERREIVVAFQQDGMVIVESGLTAGETVILDDIIPAISGVLLNPHPDVETAAALRITAAGALR